MFSSATVSLLAADDAELDRELIRGEHRDVGALALFERPCLTVELDRPRRVGRRGERRRDRVEAEARRQIEERAVHGQARTDEAVVRDSPAPFGLFILIVCYCFNFVSIIIWVFFSVLFCFHGVNLRAICIILIIGFI